MTVTAIKGPVWRTILFLRGDSISNLNEFKRLQWLDREKMTAVQQDRLTRLLIHAYHHVAYYRDILGGNGVIHNGSVNLDRFSSIPLLDKSLISKHYAELKSDDLSHRNWCENTSGGSTGEPVRFIQDKRYHDALLATKILDDLWSGYSIGERKIILWGSERDLFVGKARLRTRLGRWLRNETWLNAFRITPVQMRLYVKCINDFKPVQILAYAESIYELSRFIEREKLFIFRPKSIMTSAGVLQAHMRETIERVFQAPVFNRYGSREVGDIACECDHHQGLHVSPFTHYVEVIRQDGSPADRGEVGEIVITLLTNYAMPLLRYRIGDIGAWSEDPCTCGSAWPLLKHVAGRVSDVFRTKAATQIHGEYFTHLFYFRNWLNKFQVIQEDPDLIHVLIVPQEQAGKSRELYAKELDEITEKIRLVMGQDCEIRYDIVDDIAPTPSGKYRYTISKVEN